MFRIIATLTLVASATLTAAVVPTAEAAAPLTVTIQGSSGMGGAFSE